MKLKHVSLIAALPLVALASQAQAQARGEKIPNSYICVFKNNAVSRGNAQAEANRSVQAEGAQLKHVYNAALRGFATNAAPQAIENMKAKNPNIAYCEEDQIVTTGQFTAFGKPGGGGGVQPAQETRGALHELVAAEPEPSPRRG